MNLFILRQCAFYFPILATLGILTAPAGAAVWSNSDFSYPPDETQNWNADGNWSGIAVPDNEEARISNGGAALINTAVPDITAFLIGNSGDVNLAHSLYIDEGGSLKVTGAHAGSFRLYNTGGTHQVTVAAGGSLTVIGALVNGATIAEGHGESIFKSSGTVSTGSLATSRNAVTEILGGVFSTSSASAASGGVFHVAGGAASLTKGSFRLFENGSVKISGGSFSVEGGSGLFFFGGEEDSGGPRTFHVDGSGASDISLEGVRYFSSTDRENAVWKFTLDNGADHITPVVLTVTGDHGTTLRDGATLEVGLRGGILLSGTDTFTLIERPGSAYSNYTDFWATGPGPLWMDATDGSILQISLNPDAAMGTLDASRVGASIRFAPASTGHITLTGLRGTESRLRLKLHWSAGSGASISGFTALLEAAGITCGEISASEIGVELNPSISGASFFAWDLEASGVAGMLEGITVIQAP